MNEIKRIVDVWKGDEELTSFNDTFNFMNKYQKIFKNHLKLHNKEDYYFYYLNHPYNENLRKKFLNDDKNNWINYVKNYDDPAFICEYLEYFKSDIENIKLNENDYFYIIYEIRKIELKKLKEQIKKLKNIVDKLNLFKKFNPDIDITKYMTIISKEIGNYYYEHNNYVQSKKYLISLIDNDSKLKISKINYMLSNSQLSKQTSFNILKNIKEKDNEIHYLLGNYYTEIMEYYLAYKEYEKSNELKYKKSAKKLFEIYLNGYGIISDHLKCLDIILKFKNNTKKLLLLRKIFKIYLNKKEINIFVREYNKNYESFLNKMHILIEKIKKNEKKLLILSYNKKKYIINENTTVYDEDENYIGILKEINYDDYTFYYDNKKYIVIKENENKCEISKNIYSEESCYICYESILNDKSNEIKCHSFHENCIKKWQKINDIKRCPYCKVAF